MASEKSRAIILRVIEFSETSCIVTLFTRDFGKIGALAKGARRLKSPFESALDLLAVCRIVFLHKTSAALDLLTEAKLERRFRAGQRSLPRLYAGYYVAELLRDMTDMADPHPALFAAAEATLAALDTDAPVFTTVARFELATLHHLGHFPALTSCAACGSPIDFSGAGRIPFGVPAGGVLCSACRPGQRHVIGLTKPTLRAVQRLAQGDAEEDQEINATPAIRGEIRGLLNQYFQGLLGRSMRMHNYVSPL